MVTNKNITQLELKELLKYNPETGVFTWLNPTSYRVKKGDQTGYNHQTLDGKSYLQTSIHRRKYYLHRLVWLYLYGALPVNQIDHINGDGTDNRFCNLREVTHLSNAKNQKLKSTNTSGVCGVHWDKARKKWAVSLTHARKEYRFGRYIDWFDAVCARKSAEYKFGFHENHGQVRPL